MGHLIAAELKCGLECESEITNNFSWWERNITLFLGEEWQIDSKRHSLFQSWHYDGQLCGEVTFVDDAPRFVMPNNIFIVDNAGSMKGISLKENKKWKI